MNERKNKTRWVSFLQLPVIFVFAFALSVFCHSYYISESGTVIKIKKTTTTTRNTVQRSPRISFCLVQNPKLSEVHRVGSVIYWAKLEVKNSMGWKAHRHLKTPMWKERALRMSFKSYNIGDLEKAVNGM